MAGIDPTGIIASAQSTAENMASDAKSSIQTALGTLGQPQTIQLVGFNDQSIPGGFTVPPVPVFHGTPYVAPTPLSATAPTMSAVPAPSYGTAPVLSATAPNYVAPTKPSDLAAFAGQAPSFNDIIVPPEPDALKNINFVPPTLTDIVIPPAPVVSLPQFSAVAPSTNITAPTDFAATFQNNYADMSVSMRSALDAEMDAHLLKINPMYATQMQALEDRLTAFITGGNALPTSVEAAIYNRARGRANDEYLKSREQIYKEGAKRGFTIPAGAQFSAVTQARQQAADNNTKQSIDIATKQAEMAQANIQFAMKMSAELRTSVMGAMTSWFGSLIQLNGQGLEYARDVLTASVDLYRTMVEIATAQIQIYKAQAEVYQIQLQAVLSVYEVYKAEISALEAQVHIDVSRVEAFSAQANAYGALANAYKSVIEGVVAQAEVEKIKVEIFQSEVQSYAAQVGAKQAEWQGFTAQVQGENAKQAAYGEQVAAYGEQVKAYSTQIGAYNAQVTAITAQNESAYRVYESAVHAYGTLVNAASEAARASTANFEADVHAYSAYAQAQAANSQAYVAGAEATMRGAIAHYEAQLRVATASAESYNTYMVQAAQVAVSGANVYSSMASSALAGVSTLAAAVTTSGV